MQLYRLPLIRLIAALAVGLVIITAYLGSRQYFKANRAKSNVTRQYFDIRQHANLVSVEMLSGNQSQEIFCLRGDRFSLKVGIKNMSPFVLTSSSETRSINQPVNLAFRLHHPNSQDFYFESERTFFDQPLWPGSAEKPSNSKFTISIPCPAGKEPARLRLGLVQEAVGWQFEYSSQSWVEANLIPTDPVNFDNIPLENLTDAQRLIRRSPFGRINTEPDFVTATAIARGVFGLTMGYVNHGGTQYLVNNAGSQYPQIWLRDFASFQRALIALGWRISEGEGHWLDLFFASQYPDGQMPDWVIPSPQGLRHQNGKNDVQSDQELWAVIVAGEALARRIVDESWLNERVRGVGRREHLVAALEWSLNNRFDPKLGCLWSGHVADWGDVGLKGTSEATSTKLKSGYPRVCGTFLQALLVMALDSAYLHAGIQTVKVNGNLTDLMALKSKLVDFVRKSLWNSEGGFFKIHQHVDSFSHPFDEDFIFALGANLLAIQSGVADRTHIEKIISKILELQKSNELRTVGYVLIPPYPAGTYENPIMDQEFEYQNGADWDWFGIRAAAIIRQIDQTHSQQKLIEIARKITEQGTFYEWNPRGGVLPSSGMHFRTGAAEWLALSNRN